GAVFFLSVGFPLIAPAEKHEEEKPAADSAWEDARQEVYGQRLQANAPGEPAEQFSQEKVTKLKEILIGALKNATNIRQLKPEEYVTLWVSGATGKFRTVKQSRTNAGGDTLIINQAGIPPRKTILTMRASKADIDSYAKGKLTAEDFEKRVAITTYT